MLDMANKYEAFPSAVNVTMSSAGMVSNGVMKPSTYLAMDGGCVTLGQGGYEPSCTLSAGAIHIKSRPSDISVGHTCGA